MNQHGGAYDVSSEGETEGTSETEVSRVEEDAKDFISSSPMQLLNNKVQEHRKELQDLKNGTHSDYLRKVDKLERANDDTVRTIECWRSYRSGEIDTEHRIEHTAAEKEYELKRVDLKEVLIQDISEKKKVLDSERQTMELSGDLIEMKPIVTRKLRKRMQETPQQSTEKRRRPTSSLTVSVAIDDDDVMADLLRVYKGKLPLSLRSVPGQSAHGAHSAVASGASSVVSDQGVEVKLQDGKLFYDKKVFIRGQPVFLDQRDGTRISGTVQSIGQNEVWVRKTSGDQGRIKVPIQALLRGKYSVRKRST